MALTAGVDDYIIKPFSVGELIARVAAVLRRSRSTVTTVEPARVFGDQAVDLIAHEAWVDGEPISRIAVTGGTTWRLHRLRTNEPPDAGPGTPSTVICRARAQTRNGLKIP